MDIKFRVLTEEDEEFLYRLYVSNHAQEFAIAGLSDQQLEQMLRMQFRIQHSQYLQNYKDASFEIILLGDAPVGRLYVDRMENEIRLMEIDLLQEYQNQGIGSKIIKDLAREADQKKLPLTLHVIRHNPVINLYKRMGFEIKGDTSGSHFFMERLPGT